MKIRNYTKLLGLLCLIAFSQWSLVAQTNTIVIKIQHKATKLCNSDSGITNLTYYVRPDILRIDLNGPHANSAFIFQPSSEKIWVLYHHEKVYYSMSKTDMEVVNSEIKKAEEEIKRKIEAEKAAGNDASSIIWSDGHPLQSDNLEYLAMKKQDSLISLLMCKKYQAMRKDGGQNIMFLNNLKSTGVKDEELQILNLFAEFMGKGTSVLAGSMDFTAFRKRDQNAYPILIENKKNKEVCNQLLLKIMYRDVTKDELFKVPVNFGKLENPLGHRR